jgi:RNA ligase
VTKLEDILDVNELNKMRRDGYIRQATHPTLPLVSECYTKQTMWEQAWTHETRTCRGLIWNTETGLVTARPFAKFFNYGEPSCPELKPTTRVLAFDKLDGSLGILYNTPDGPAIATKNSFQSPQAVHATRLLRERYDEWEAPYGTTALFEIIYPDNRIVLDYHDVDDLFLLGIMNNETGISWGHQGVQLIGHPFPTPQLLHIQELQDVLKLADRENREGMVLKVSSKEIRVKIKQKDYLELHKICTGLNKKQLWKWLYQGREIEEILMDIPEELHDWALPVLQDLCNKFCEWDLYITERWLEIREEGWHEFRDLMAELVSEFPPWLSHGIFLLMDKDYKRYHEMIWKMVRPTGEKR